MQLHYRASPHPHLFIDQIVASDTYRAMAFPDALVAPGESWGITSSDARYADVLRDPLWRALHEELCGKAFVFDVLRHFTADMRAARCLVDPDLARLVPFIETRDQKELRTLADAVDANDIFTRLDFQSKPLGAYRDFVHLDWARRIVGAILFFSDATEEGLEGGELALYRDRGFRNDRWCHDPELTALFAPKANTGVIFLNSNAGFHGPRPITALRGRRRWLYYTISSRQDVWPCEPRVADALTGSSESAPAAE
ncbi:MAG: 2OG-Fe(II) oxygenase [Vicinamibacterales bacterium]